MFSSRSSRGHWDAGLEPAADRHMPQVVGAIAGLDQAGAVELVHPISEKRLQLRGLVTAWAVGAARGHPIHTTGSVPEDEGHYGVGTFTL